MNSSRIACYVKYLEMDKINYTDEPYHITYLPNITLR